MTREKNQYKKLIRTKSTGVYSFGSLWQGADHLLLVESRKFSENYKRFYHDDIQAIVTAKTSFGKVLNAVFTALAGCAAIIIIATHGSWVAAGFTLFFLILLAVNILWGPTCHCHIRTAVQTTRLAPVKRLRKARKLIASVRPLIKVRQGRLDQARLTAAMASDHAKAPAWIENRPVRPQHGDAAKAPVRWLFFQILFALLLVNVGFMAVGLMTTQPLTTLLEVFVDLAVFIINIICLVRLYIAEIRGVLRPLLWTTLVYNGLRYAAGYVLMMYYVISGQINPNNQWQMVLFFSHLSPHDSPFYMGYFLFSLIGSVILGGLGLLLVIRRQDPVARRQPEFTEQPETIKAG